MKHISFLAVLLIVSSLGDLGAQSPAAKPGTQTLCPIMGNKIDPAVSTVFEGKKIYFCCPGCVGKFRETPQTLIDKMEKDGVVLESVAATGSVSSEAGQAASGSDHDHARASHNHAETGHNHTETDHDHAGMAPAASDSSHSAPSSSPDSSASHGCCGGH